jgi:CRISPR-associated protein Cas5d
LEAILWKPAIRWRIERLHVLAPIKFESIKRNEVASKASVKGNLSLYFADEDRAQRNTVVLRDVDYVLEAHFELTDRAEPDDTLQKFVGMFERRLAKGQCFHTPYLGCREFAARVEPAPETWEVHESLREPRDLGMMLLDMQFSNGGSGFGTPVFFAARLANGCVDVPEIES